MPSLPAIGPLASALGVGVSNTPGCQSRGIAVTTKAPLNQPWAAVVSGQRTTTAPAAPAAGNTAASSNPSSSLSLASSALRPPIQNDDDDDDALEPSCSSANGQPSLRPGSIATTITPKGSHKGIPRGRKQSISKESPPSATVKAAFPTQPGGTSWSCQADRIRTLERPPMKAATSQQPSLVREDGTHSRNAVSSSLRNQGPQGTSALRTLAQTHTTLSVMSSSSRETADVVAPPLQQLGTGDHQSKNDATLTTSKVIISESMSVQFQRRWADEMSDKDDDEDVEPVDVLNTTSSNCSRRPNGVSQASPLPRPSGQGMNASASKRDNLEQPQHLSWRSPGGQLQQNRVSGGSGYAVSGTETKLGGGQEQRLPNVGRKTSAGFGVGRTMGGVDSEPFSQPSRGQPMLGTPSMGRQGYDRQDASKNPSTKPDTLGARTPMQGAAGSCSGNVRGTESHNFFSKDIRNVERRTSFVSGPREPDGRGGAQFSTGKMASTNPPASSYQDRHYQRRGVFTNKNQQEVPLGGQKSIASSDWRSGPSRRGSRQQKEGQKIGMHGSSQRTETAMYPSTLNDQASFTRRQRGGGFQNEAMTTTASEAQRIPQKTNLLAGVSSPSKSPSAPVPPEETESAQAQSTPDASGSASRCSSSRPQAESFVSEHQQQPLLYETAIPASTESLAVPSYQEPQLGTKLSQEALGSGAQSYRSSQQQQQQQKSSASAMPSAPSPVVPQQETMPISTAEAAFNQGHSESAKDAHLVAGRYATKTASATTSEHRRASGVSSQKESSDANAQNQREKARAPLPHSIDTIRRVSATPIGLSYGAPNAAFSDQQRIPLAASTAHHPSAATASPYVPPLQAIPAIGYQTCQQAAVMPAGWPRPDAMPNSIAVSVAHNAAPAVASLTTQTGPGYTEGSPVELPATGQSYMVPLVRTTGGPAGMNHEMLSRTFSFHNADQSHQCHNKPAEDFPQYATRAVVQQQNQQQRKPQVYGGVPRQQCGEATATGDRAGAEQINLDHHGAHPVYYDMNETLIDGRRNSLTTPTPDMTTNDQSASFGRLPPTPRQMGGGMMVMMAAGRDEMVPFHAPPFGAAPPHSQGSYFYFPQPSSLQPMDVYHTLTHQTTAPNSGVVPSHGRTMHLTQGTLGPTPPYPPPQQRLSHIVPAAYYRGIPVYDAPLVQPANALEHQTVATGLTVATSQVTDPRAYDVRTPAGLGPASSQPQRQMNGPAVGTSTTTALVGYPGLMNHPTIVDALSPNSVLVPNQEISTTVATYPPHPPTTCCMGQQQNHALPPDASPSNRPRQKQRGHPTGASATPPLPPASDVISSPNADRYDHRKKPTQQCHYRQKGPVPTIPVRNDEQRFARRPNHTGSFEAGRKPPRTQSHGQFRDIQNEVSATQLPVVSCDLSAAAAFIRGQNHPSHVPHRKRYDQQQSLDFPQHCVLPLMETPCYDAVERRFKIKTMQHFQNQQRLQFDKTYRKGSVASYSSVLAQKGTSATTKFSRRDRQFNNGPKPNTTDYVGRQNGVHRKTTGKEGHIHDERRASAAKQLINNGQAADSALRVAAQEMSYGNATMLTSETPSTPPPKPLKIDTKVPSKERSYGSSHKIMPTENAKQEYRRFSTQDGKQQRPEGSSHHDATPRVRGGEGSLVVDNNGTQRAICRHFLVGRCTYANCNFAHVDQSVEKPATGLAMGNRDQRRRNGPQQQQQYSRRRNQGGHFGARTPRDIPEKQQLQKQGASLEQESLVDDMSSTASKRKPLAQEEVLKNASEKTTLLEVHKTSAFHREKTEERRIYNPQKQKSWESSLASQKPLPRGNPPEKEQKNEQLFLSSPEENLFLALPAQQEVRGKERKPKSNNRRRKSHTRKRNSSTTAPLFKDVPVSTEMVTHAQESLSSSNQHPRRVNKEVPSSSRFVENGSKSVVYKERSGTTRGFPENATSESGSYGRSGNAAQPLQTPLEDSAARTSEPLQQADIRQPGASTVLRHQASHQQQNKRKASVNATKSSLVQEYEIKTEISSTHVAQPGGSRSISNKTEQCAEDQVAQARHFMSSIARTLQPTAAAPELKNDDGAVGLPSTHPEQSPKLGGNADVKIEQLRDVGTLSLQRGANTERQSKRPYRRQRQRQNLATRLMNGDSTPGTNSYATGAEAVGASSMLSNADQVATSSQYRASENNNNKRVGGNRRHLPSAGCGRRNRQQRSGETGASLRFSKQHPPASTEKGQTVKKNVML